MGQYVLYIWHLNKPGKWNLLFYFLTEQSPWSHCTVWCLRVKKIELDGIKNISSTKRRKKCSQNMQFRLYDRVVGITTFTIALVPLKIVSKLEFCQPSITNMQSSSLKWKEKSISFFLCSFCFLDDEVVRNKLSNDFRHTTQLLCFQSSYWLLSDPTSF